MSVTVMESASPAPSDGLLSCSRLGDAWESSPSPTGGVILLHGFLGSGRNLRTLGLRLLERRPSLPVLIPDLRGHGQSPPWTPPHPTTAATTIAAAPTLQGLARDVLATAAHHGLATPYHIIGHSLGGRVALAAAGIAPALIAHVTLLDIGPSPLDPARSESRPVLDALLAAPAEASDRRAMRAVLVAGGLSPALTDWLLMNLVTQDKHVRWNIDRTSLETLHGLSLREDLWDVVQAAQVPLHCVRGGRSRYVGQGEAARLQAAGCPVDVLPDAGHFVHVDALEPLLDLLTPNLPAASAAG